MNNEQFRSFSDNVWTIFTARLAMITTPFVISGLVWLGVSWLDGKFDRIAVPLQRMENRIDVLERSERAMALKNQSQDIYIQSNKDAVSTIAEQVKSLGGKIDGVDKSLDSLTRVLEERERRASRLSP